jgi:hypothetical protein
MASAALPEPRPALTAAEPPFAGDDPGDDPGPRALAAGVVPDPAYQAMFAEAEAGAGPAGDAAASEPGPDPDPPAARAASNGTRKPRRRPARPPAPPAPGG